jgi:hypothetical protein
MGEISIPQLDYEFGLGSLGSSLWWWAYGLFVLIGIVFIMAIIYHWLRYETNTGFSSIVIGVNALVIALLLGGAAINLQSFLTIT